MLVLYFPLEVFLTDLLGRGVCLCVPILGPTGCILLCGAVNTDVGSVPISSNNVCETHDLQYIISSFSFTSVAFST